VPTLHGSRQGAKGKGGGQGRPAPPSQRPVAPPQRPAAPARRQAPAKASLHRQDACATRDKGIAGSGGSIGEKPETGSLKLFFTGACLFSGSQALAWEPKWVGSSSSPGLRKRRHLAGGVPKQSLGGKGGVPQQELGNEMKMVGGAHPTWLTPRRQGAKRRGWRAGTPALPGEANEQPRAAVPHSPPPQPSPLKGEGVKN
jgi:hypothetical protein